MPADSSGPTLIESGNEKSTVPATGDDQKQSYPKLLATFDLVGSESMRLIDESATHLHERMKNAETVIEACLCANQIAKLLRLKLDVRRTGRD